MADLGPKWKKLSPQKKASYNLKATEVTLFEVIECDENYKKNLYFYRCTTRTTRNWPLTILTFQTQFLSVIGLEDVELTDLKVNQKSTMTKLEPTVDL